MILFRTVDSVSGKTACEVSVVDDPENGLLFDRYACFLFSERRLDDAMEKARGATRLLPTDSKTWFTRGLIESRTGNAEAAERSLMRAEELGKALHLCRLQMTYGYSNAKPPRTSDAFAALTIARDSAPPRGSPQDERHLAEVETLRKKVASQVRRRRVGQ